MSGQRGSRQKLVLLSLALILAIGGASHLATRIYFLNKLAKKKSDYKRSLLSLDRSRLWKQNNLPYQKAICDAINAQKPSSATDRIVLARKYVRSAFADITDEWYDKYKYDNEVVLETLYRHHLDPDQPKAHLDCQPSSRVFASILHALGFQTRMIAFLSDDLDDYIMNHANLEVFNPETKRWELHDTQYDIHFLNKDSGEVLTAIDLAFGPMENVVPSNGDVQGWEACSLYFDTTVIRDHLYEVLAYKHVTRDTFVLVNRDRISLTKTFSKHNGQTMVEFINSVYGSPPILILPDGDYGSLPLTTTP